MPTLPKPSTVKLIQSYRQWIEQQDYKAPYILYYDAKIKDCPWSWYAIVWNVRYRIELTMRRPLNEQGKCLEPNQLIGYQDKHDFHMPSCLCVLLDQGVKHMEACIVVGPQIAYMFICSRWSSSLQYVCWLTVTRALLYLGELGVQWVLIECSSSNQQTCLSWARSFEYVVQYHVLTSAMCLHV